MEDTPTEDRWTVEQLIQSAKLLSQAELEWVIVQAEALLAEREASKMPSDEVTEISSNE